MRPDSTIQWQAYPALLLAGCLGAGIVLAAAGPVDTFWLWTGFGLGGAGILLAAERLGRGRLVSPAPLVRTVALALVVVALGGARYTARHTLPADHIAHHVYAQAAPENPVAVAGRVVGTPLERPTGIRFVLAADSLLLDDSTYTVRGRVQVSLAHSPWRPRQRYPALAPGDSVRLVGRLRPLPARRNPADFDYGGFLRRRGLYATLSVRDSAAVMVGGRQRSIFGHLIAETQATIRTRFANFIASAEARIVLYALVLGDRSGLEAETREQFARTGLMHLLAVSGLHVLLVGMIFYALLRPLLGRLGLSWRPMEISRAAATMLLLLLYLFVAGAGASVVRAVVMAGLFLGGAVLQREAHPLNTLGAAALVLLLVRPDQLFEPGFQLSFAAVAAIVTLHPRIIAPLPEAWREHPLARSALGLTTVSVAATLGTAPVLLYHFGQVSFAGLLLNLAAIPLTALTLAAGLATLALGGMLPEAASIFGDAANLLARGLLWTAETGDAVLGGTVVRAYVRDPWRLLAMAAGLAMLAQWPRPRLRWRLGVAALALAGGGLWLTISAGRNTPRLDVLFLDVGHGDAALVTTPGGRRLLVDAGGRDALVDHGHRTILPHLERFGIRRLDAVVITHPHSDHLGGLPALLRAMPVGRVLHNGRPYASALYAETQHLLDSLGVPHRAVGVGDTLALDPSVRVQILAPEDSMTEVNEASVVLRVLYGETAFLFTGDAEAEAERLLVARYDTLLASDVIKVPHHGSRTSSSPPFAARVAPDSSEKIIAVISVGPAGRFGLPDEEVVARWHTHAAVWLTAEQGALWLRSDGTRIDHVRWRE